MQRFWLFWVSGANYWELARSDTLPFLLSLFLSVVCWKILAAIAETGEKT